MHTTKIPNDAPKGVYRALQYYISSIIGCMRGALFGYVLFDVAQNDHSAVATAHACELI